MPYNYFLQDLRNRSEYLLLIGEFNQLVWIMTTEILRFISTPFMLLYMCVCVYALRTDITNRKISILISKIVVA